MIRRTVCGAGAVLAVWASMLGAQDRYLTLAIGDAIEDYGVVLVEGPDPIERAAGRYCVQAPDGATLNHYDGAAKRADAPLGDSGAASASASSASEVAAAGAPDVHASTGPTPWIPFETGAAAVFYMTADGEVEGETWEARPAQMFMRRDAMDRIHVCVGGVGMEPPPRP